MVYYALLAFFFLDYVRPSSYVPALSVLSLNSVVPIFATVLSLFCKGPVSNIRVLLAPNALAIGSMLGLIGLSVLTADVTLYAYNTWTTVFGYGLMYFVIAKQATTVERIKGIFATLVVVHLIVAALNPSMLLTPEVRSYVASGAFLGDGNDFALSVNITLAFCVFLIVDERRRARSALLMLAALILVACVIATQSRGGTIAIATLGLYYWLKSQKKLQTALVVAACVTLVFLFAPAQYFERMNQINTTEGSAVGRIEAWKGATRMARDHPFLGIGAGHFAVKYGEKYRPSLDFPWQTAHSIYFLALGELGYPGLIVLLVFIIMNLVANRMAAAEIRQRAGPSSVQHLELLASLSAGLIAFAVGGAFLSALYYPHIYVLGGLLTAARRLVLAEASEPSATVAPRSAAKPITLHWALQRPQVSRTLQGS